MIFEFAPSAKFRSEKIGAEEQTVIVIDNALSHARELAEEAAQLNYGAIGPHFPGPRAPASAEFHRSAAASLRPVIAAELGIEAGMWALECYFSLVARPPERLTPIQRLPHFDGIEHDRIAAILYLCPPVFGGTAFYRHRRTGFETVTTDRFETYRQTLEYEVQRGGIPPAAYIGDGAPMFERIAEFGAAFNRMLVYRGASLHCSSVPHPERLSEDPRTGRLTMNFFLRPGDS